MKKVLVGIIVAAVLFAVGAFAAEITTVNSEDIASGNDTVDACADEVDIDFDTVYDDTDDWDVTGADITFYSGGFQTLECDGFDATIEIHHDGSVTEGGPATVSGSTADIIDITGVKAKDVTSAAILVDGQTLLEAPFAP